MLRLLACGYRAFAGLPESGQWAQIHFSAQIRISSWFDSAIIAATSSERLREET
jgi:hypothetical protein